MMYAVRYTLSVAMIDSSTDKQILSRIGLSLNHDDRSSPPLWSGTNRWRRLCGCRGHRLTSGAT